MLFLLDLEGVHYLLSFGSLVRTLFLFYFYSIMGNKMVLKEVVTWMTFSRIISQAVPRKGFIDILAADSGDVGQSDSFCQLADFLYYFLLDFVKL